MREWDDPVLPEYVLLLHLLEELSIDQEELTTVQQDIRNGTIPVIDHL